jgi:hypothetical protein
MLGIPLHVTLAFPSASGPDANCISQLEVDADQWKRPWSDECQAEWIDCYLPMLMAKQSVVGISWSHFSDAAPHYFPHAGLLDAQNRPKPSLEHIVKYRRAYWVADGQS